MSSRTPTSPARIHLVAGVLGAPLSGPMPAGGAAPRTPENWSGTWKRAQPLAVRRPDPATRRAQRARRQPSGRLARSRRARSGASALDDTSLRGDRPCRHGRSPARPIQRRCRRRTASRHARGACADRGSLVDGATAPFRPRGGRDPRARTPRLASRRSRRGVYVEQAPAESSAAQARPPGRPGSVRGRDRGQRGRRSHAPLHRGASPDLRAVRWMPADARTQDKLLLAEVVAQQRRARRGVPLRFSAHVVGVGDRRRYVLEITTVAGVVPASVVIDR